MQATDVVARLRRDRPEPEFTISIRSHWDGKDVGMMKERVAAYAAAGVQHIISHRGCGAAAPARRRHRHRSSASSSCIRT
jgi:hypothetical protein